MYWLCMIATIPLATGNKLNCFISARGLLAIVWQLCWLCFVCFLLIFDMLINHLLKKKLTILRHFLKIFSMIHIPPKPIASDGCDTTLFLCKK